jgi:glycerol-3-phosphate O-acyltransferase/dihydroxyacetone phosphate acyltransferase
VIAYRLLRALGRLALQWFYREIEVVGIERLPVEGPVLLASNHPNALVDALVVGCTLSRPVVLTAKATLLENPLTRMLLRTAGVVPLRRVSDAVRPGGDGKLNPARNADAFATVLDVLEAGGVVLLFPEGKSHSDPALAPLKTGLARIATMARVERGLVSVPIIPIGLTFEQKWEPRSRVLMHLGPPIMVGAGDHEPNDVATLTRRVDAALRAVTLNFRSTEEAYRVLSISTIIAELLDEFRPLHRPDPPLENQVRVAHRIAGIIPRLSGIDPDVRPRIERFLARLANFERVIEANGITASDVQMSSGATAGVWFVIREVLIAAVAGPFALWGRINHWVPLRIARSLALKMSRTQDEPATNTIVAGLVLVLAFYVSQVSIVAWWLGWAVAMLYAVSLPLSATWDFRYADRLQRGIVRVQTYLQFRRDPDLHRRLLDDLTWLRDEAVALNALIAPVASLDPVVA